VTQSGTPMVPGKFSDARSILVIDDDPLVREVLHELLNGESYISLEAETGSAGLQIMASAVVDLVILDIFMPDVDGVEALRVLRVEWPSVPVICVSGGSASVGASTLFGATMLMGAFATIMKPFREAELLTLIHQALDERPA